MRRAPGGERRSLPGSLPAWWLVPTAHRTAAETQSPCERRPGARAGIRTAGRRPLALLPARPASPPAPPSVTLRLTLFVCCMLAWTRVLADPRRATAAIKSRAGFWRLARRCSRKTRAVSPQTVFQGSSRTSARAINKTTTKDCQVLNNDLCRVDRSRLLWYRYNLDYCENIFTCFETSLNSGSCSLWPLAKLCSFPGTAPTRRLSKPAYRLHSAQDLLGFQPVTFILTSPPLCPPVHWELEPKLSARPRSDLALPCHSDWGL